VRAARERGLAPAAATRATAGQLPPGGAAEARATARRRLLYVPRIAPDTLLFFFYRGATGRSYSFRDYSPATGVRVSYASDYPYSVDEILAMAELGFDAPEHDTNDFAFWHERILELNRRHLASPPHPAADTAAGRSDAWAAEKLCALLAALDARDWWPALLELARRDNPALELDPDDLPRVERAGGPGVHLVLTGRGQIGLVALGLGPAPARDSRPDAERDPIADAVDALLGRAEGRRPFFWVVCDGRDPDRAHAATLRRHRDDPAALARALPARPPEAVHAVARNLASVRWPELLALLRRGHDALWHELARRLPPESA
jgi:hypothetical protein